MFGWFRAEAARASRWNRSKLARSLARSSGRNLSATRRPSLVILSLVDHTHPAATQLLDDAVVRNGLPDHRLVPQRIGERIEIRRVGEISRVLVCSSKTGVIVAVPVSVGVSPLTTGVFTVPVTYITFT